MIDLSSNESCYPPSEKVLESVVTGFDQTNRYVVHEKIDELRKSIGKYCGVSEEQIIIGPGTDWINKEIVCRFGSDKNLVLFNPCFSKFLSSAKYICKRIIKIQLSPPEFSIDLNESIKDPSLIFIDSPNNPTGQYLIKESQLVELLEEDSNYVIIDEAGFEYGKETFVHLIEKYDNLAITRTFDKAFALAGFRISWLIAGDKFLKRFMPSDSLVNSFDCLAAMATLKEKEYMEENVEKTILQRDFLRDELTEFGIKVFSSKGNYLLVNTKIPNFALILRKAGIIIEDLSQTWIKGFYRITVGTKKENIALINIIKSEINPNKNNSW